MNAWITIGLIAMAAVLAYVVWRRQKKRQFWYIGGVKIPRKFKYQYTTPGGTPESPSGSPVWSVSPVPEFVLGWIDEAYYKLYDTVRTAKPTWNVPRYPVLIIEPTGKNSGGVPIIAVGDGRTAYAMTIGVNNDGYAVPSAVLPDYSSAEWQFMEYFRNGTRFEGEHIAMWLNDRAMFYNHIGGNDVHPVFPDEHGQRGEYAHAPWECSMHASK